MTTLDKHQLEQRVLDLEGRIAWFDDQAETGHAHMDRLRSDKPRHPALLLMHALRGLGAVVFIAAVAVMTITQLALPWAVQVAEIETLVGVSVPWVMLLLALCTWTVSLGAWAWAERRGDRSPMLDEELLERQELVAELLRLRTLRDVRERTPDVAPTRPDYQVAMPERHEWTPPPSMHFHKQEEDAP